MIELLHEKHMNACGSFVGVVWSEDSVATSCSWTSHERDDSPLARRLLFTPPSWLIPHSCPNLDDGANTVGGSGHRRLRFSREPRRAARLATDLSTNQLAWCMS